MKRILRRTSGLLRPLGASVLLGLFAGCARMHREWEVRPDSSGPPPNAAEIMSAPVAVYARTHAGFCGAWDWELVVSPRGKAVAMVLHFADEGGAYQWKQRVGVGTEALQALRRSIAESNFFALDPVYGDDVVDASSRTLVVRVGDYQRTVLIQNFNNRLVGNDPQLISAQRLLRIWQTVRSFVTLPEGCLDFSDEDKEVMDWQNPPDWTREQLFQFVTNGMPIPEIVRILRGKYISSPLTDDGMPETQKMVLQYHFPMFYLRVETSARTEDEINTSVCTSLSTWQ